MGQVYAQTKTGLKIFCGIGDCTEKPTHRIEMDVRTSRGILVTHFAHACGGHIRAAKEQLYSRRLFNLQAFLISKGVTEHPVLGKVADWREQHLRAFCQQAGIRYQGQEKIRVTQL